jgi:hypothetical protein
VQKQEIPEEEEPLQGKKINPIQRQEITEEQEPLQGKFINKVQRREIPEDEEPLQTKKENNTGMPDNLKDGVESLSGIDMSDVRVHYNSGKPTEVGALAYTQGTDIHVSPGQEKHLPHEAWHVVQQVQGRVGPTTQLKNVMVNDDRELEQEADKFAERLGVVQTTGFRDLKAQPMNKIENNQTKIILGQQELEHSFNTKVVQRVTIQIIPLVPPVGNVTIQDIIFGERAESPFAGTMGAHTTAWVAICDTLKNQLIGLDIIAANVKLNRLLTEAEKDISLRFLKDLHPLHLQKLAETLIRAGQKIDVVKISVPEVRALKLQEAISDYLDVVNLLPFSTIWGADTGGHGEGTIHGYIKAYEEGGDLRYPRDISTPLELLWGLFDFNAVNVEAKKEEGELFPSYDIAKDPRKVFNNPAEKDKLRDIGDAEHERYDPMTREEELIAVRIAKHIDYMLIAYPRTSELAGIQREENIMQILRDERGFDLDKRTAVQVLGFYKEML